jgi:polysaccharide deacetylase 2 family uncharacterized protein YibQ
MGRRRTTPGPVSWAALVLGLLVGTAFVLYYLDRPGVERPAGPGRKAPPAQERPELREPGEAAPPEARPAKPDDGSTMVKPLPAPMIAIVIDDMGRDVERLREVLLLGLPVTIAVLPHLRHSAKVADEAHAKGVEVILHLPMEPDDLKANDPGKGALLTAMDARDVRRLVEEDLTAVPHAVGVNNHMGSRFTEDEALMTAVLEVVRDKDLFFLDSRTTAGSVGAKLAGTIGVRNAHRSVFLDNSRDVAHIKGQVSKLVAIARRRGKAVAIGHPYPETIEALRQSLAYLDGSGVEVVRLSEIVE